MQYIIVYSHYLNAGFSMVWLLSLMMRRLGKVYRHGQQTQKDEAIVLRDLTVSEPGVSPSKFEQEIWTNENEDFSSKLII